jgi:hypothetical protein
VTIKCKQFLNIDVVNPTSDALPFTSDFLEKSTFRTVDFVEHFGSVLTRMSSDNLIVTGVTSDGCAFQRKALTWRDPDSLQNRFPIFSKVLFVPCVCHRIHNAIIQLFKTDPIYRQLISQARDAAIILRQPHVREMLGLTCPSHCATRWIYDYPLVRFIFNHFEEAVQVLANLGFGLSDQVPQLVPLLEPVFLAVRALECDDASAAAVVPELNRLMTSLNAQADLIDEPLKQMYLHSAAIISKRVFAKSGYPFQLAYVFTPFGREYARNQIGNPHQHQISPSMDDEDHDPSDRVGFGLAGDPNDSDCEEDLLRRADDTSDQIRDDNSALRDPQEEPDEEESDDDPDYGGISYICRQAEQGLKEILVQYQIPEPSETEEIIGIFQYYVTASPADLRLKPIPDKNRYAWGVMKAEEGPWAVLADIALPVETLVCNEAVSERTNGTMRRLLAPLRLKMGRDILLSRLTIFRHGDPGSRPK